MAIALAGIGLGLSVIGTGIGAYSSYRAGQTANTIANFNAATQERNARLQMASMTAQAKLAQRQAEANFRLRSAEAQARMNNAVSIENQALSQDAINRENQRKRTDQFARQAATQRAQIAASGVIESTGTPLDLLAETAGTIQRDREEQGYAQELQRRTLFREADMERLGGKLALARATLDRSSSLAEASLRMAAGKASFLGGMREAELTRLSGGANARAGTIGALGTLFSGLSSATGSFMNLKSAGAFKLS